MARGHWRTGHSVAKVLAEEPYRFDPYQAARLLEALSPLAPEVGSTEDPRREAVRFVGAAGLGFPASPLLAYSPAEKGKAAELTITFLDLTGQNGPLPHAYTDLVRDRLSRRDKAMKAFLDMFVHRLVSLMVRAKRTYYPGLDNRPPDQGDMTGYLRSLIGLGTPALAGRLPVPDRLFLKYAALLASHPRSSSGLKQMISDMVQAPVKVKPLVGKWLPISKSDYSRLPDGDGFGGQNTTLGHNMVLGTKAWSQIDEIELEIGPLSRTGFNALLPGGEQHIRVASAIRFYLERDMDVSLRLILKRTEMTALRLTSRLTGDGPRLAHTSWLATRRPKNDDTQVVVEVPSIDALRILNTRRTGPVSARGDAFASDVQEINR